MAIYHAITARHSTLATVTTIFVCANLRVTVGGVASHQVDASDDNDYSLDPGVCCFLVSFHSVHFPGESAVW